MRKLSSSFSILIYDALLIDGVSIVRTQDIIPPYPIALSNIPTIDPSQHTDLTIAYHKILKTWKNRTKV